MCLYILPTYSFERVYIFDSIFCLQVVSSVFTFSTRYFVEIRVSKNRNRARGKNENTWRHSVFESRGDKTYRCDLFKRNLFNAIYPTLVIIFTSAAPTLRNPRRLWIRISPRLRLSSSPFSTPKNVVTPLPSLASSLQPIFQVRTGGGRGEKRLEKPIMTFHGSLRHANNTIPLNRGGGCSRKFI